MGVDDEISLVGVMVLQRPPLLKVVDENLTQVPSAQQGERSKR